MSFYILLERDIKILIKSVYYLSMHTKKKKTFGS